MSVYYYSWYLAAFILLQDLLWYSPVSSCLDIVDVFPHPYSIIQPVDWDNKGYSIQVTFSQPVAKIELDLARASIVLSPVVFPYSLYSQQWHERLSVTRTILLPNYIFFNWFGSERSILVIFSIDKAEWKARYVIIYTVEHLYDNVAASMKYLGKPCLKTDVQVFHLAGKKTNFIHCHMHYFQLSPSIHHYSNILLHIWSR